jgi:hypothetical protein
VTRPADHLRIVAHQQHADPLVMRAARLWPDNPDLQLRWLRAVAVVRKTRRGWLLDRPQARLQ